MPAASINNVIGERFIELLSVDSTNNYAMQQVQKGLVQHGTVYFAFEQTAGKGQLSKQWLSTKGENIIMSVVIDASGLHIKQQFILNMLAALSIHELFNNYSTEKAKIKWPNDVYWRARKAAGILIENIIRGKTWHYAIAGFGININQTKFTGDLKNPVSLKQITGNYYNVIELAKELCMIFDKNFKQLISKNEPAILKNYNRVLFKINETAQFKKGATIFSAAVKGVDEMGRLILQTDRENKFENGAIEWLILNDY